MDITDDLLAQCEDDTSELVRILAAEVLRLRRKDQIWKAEVKMLADSAKELGGVMVERIAELEAALEKEKE